MEFRTDRVERVSQDADGVHLGLRSGEKILAQYVFAADGLHSKVRRELGVGVQKGAHNRFGVRKHFQIAPWSERVEVYWAEGAEAYVTPFLITWWVWPFSLSLLATLKL